jgi:4-hydroxy-tetrahydrodipicolinate synthase
VRTIVDIQVATLARCRRELKNVIGVKDATANVARVTQQRLQCGEDFIQLSGEDATVLGFMAHGGVGCISVTSNVAPRLCADFQNACARGDWKAALAVHDRLMPLHDALFVETNPGPVKYAVWRLGITGTPDARLPLAPVSEATMRTVDAALAQVGLLQAKAAE